MVNPSSPAPAGSRHPVGVFETLMPHLHAGRHHRLHGGLVAAIVAVISVALVSGGPATHPTPPQPGRGGSIVPHVAASGSLHRAMRQSTQTPWGSVGLTSISLAAGTDAIVDLGNGVTVTLAPGWAVTNRTARWANLYSNDKNAGAYIDQGTAIAPDINQESARVINQVIQSGGMTNVQQISAGPVTAIQGKNFQQLLEIDYTANMQSNQGTGQTYGAWVTLFNPSTHNAGFFALYAWSPDEYKAALPDGAGMMLSME
jgi:hypothetical protein